MLAYLIQPGLPLFCIAIIGDFTWRVSDCEELVGVTLIGDFGLGFDWRRLFFKLYFPVHLFV
jgi:hypothetical protein